MARQSWVQIDGKLVPKHEAWKHRKQPARSSIAFPMVAPKFRPYRSVVDGSEIIGRTAHRNHLAENGCEESGSEKPQWMQDKIYAEKHGETYVPPPHEEYEGVEFQWLEPGDALADSSLGGDE